MMELFNYIQHLLAQAPHRQATLTKCGESAYSVAVDWDGTAPASVMQEIRFCNPTGKELERITRLCKYHNAGLQYNRFLSIEIDPDTHNWQDVDEYGLLEDAVSAGGSENTFIFDWTGWAYYTANGTPVDRNHAAFGFLPIPPSYE